MPQSNCNTILIRVSFSQKIFTFLLSNEFYDVPFKFVNSQVTASRGVLNRFQARVVSQCCVIYLSLQTFLD